MRNLVLPIVVLMATVGFFVAAFQVFSRDYQYVQLVKLGDRLMDEELPYQASRTYGSAIGLRPDKPLAYVKRAEALQKQGNLASALEDLSEASGRGADPLTVSLHQANIYYDRGNFDEAVAYYSEVLELDPRSPSVLYKLGLASFRAGREDAAIDVLTHAIETQDGFAEAYYLRAAVFHALGRDAETETDLLKTLTLRPDAGAARLAIIEFYLDTGKTTRALRVAREEIDRQPQAPSSYLLLAEVHRRRGRHDQAIAAVGLALEQDPNLPDAYLRLGQLWLEDGVSRNDKVALEKAVVALESVSQLENENGPASLALGQAYLAIGDEDRAFDELQRAAEATPIQAEAHRELGDLYLGRENFADAATAYHVYLKLGEQSPRVLERLGDAYAGMDNQSAAAETYLQLATHSPNRMGPLVKAARAYLAAGEPRLAARVCEQGLATDAQNETLRDLLARASDTVPAVANP